MARDRRLLEGAEAGAAGCRVYRWDGVWVSLGRFQHPERDLLWPDRTRWVVRPTGGKAVLHGHDVTVGIAVPLALLGMGDSRRALKPAYRWVASLLVAGLREAGVPAALAERTAHESRGVRTADCFAFTSANDIVREDTGAKVCGCALRLTDRAVLVQASLPNGPALVDPRSVLREAAVESGDEWDADRFAEGLERAWRAFGEVGINSGRADRGF